MDSNLKMEPVFWKIYSPEFYLYDRIQLKKDILKHLDAYNFKLNRPRKKVWKLFSLDCAFVYYFIRELSSSNFYRCCVIQNVIIWNAPDILLLMPTRKNLIDYNWNERIYELVRERCEVDHAFSWLSTLGGAFSALGDYFEECADTAGKISVNQLKLALRIGDPHIQARCRLYLSLSLIQKKKFKMAKKIIRNEYQLAKKQIVVDERLIRMCKGIWSKLQYEQSIYRNNRQINM